MKRNPAPAGFCDTDIPHLNHAHDYAQLAKTLCVKIKASHVETEVDGWDPTTDFVMVEY
jgi:hypothetical protein